MSVAQNIVQYISTFSCKPLFFAGDARTLLQCFPDASVDCVVTSPPFWKKREYANGGIGLEDSFEEYIDNLLAIITEIRRVLKRQGSFWLNLGDSYYKKSLLGIPWRVALKMTEPVVIGAQQRLPAFEGETLKIKAPVDWVLRNEVIWNKVKGGFDNTTDKLGNVHEQLFHFVKDADNYYYNVDTIRSKPGKSKVVNGAVVTATGVSGITYRRQIKNSTALTAVEKRNAFNALNNVLLEVKNKQAADFRMTIRGSQRVAHSTSRELSGRARELEEKGFFIIKYHPRGSKPHDVWSIVSENTQNRDEHFAAYPEDLCKIPILATCPDNGIVLDPFCGTGTTNYVTMNLGRKSIGIDISDEYLKIARKRCRESK